MLFWISKGGALGAISHRRHEWNTIRDATPPMYSTRIGIRSGSSIKASVAKIKPSANTASKQELGGYDSLNWDPNESQFANQIAAQKLRMPVN